MKQLIIQEMLDAQALAQLKGNDEFKDDTHIAGELVEAAKTYILNNPDLWPWGDNPPSLHRGSRANHILGGGLLIAEMQRRRRLVDLTLPLRTATHIRDYMIEQEPFDSEFAYEVAKAITYTNQQPDINMETLLGIVEHPVITLDELFSRTVLSCSNLT